MEVRVRPYGITLIDLDPDSRSPRIIATDVGGALANGYVHSIDRVLRPLSTANSMSSLVANKSPRGWPSRSRWVSCLLFGE